MHVRGLILLAILGLVAPSRAIAQGCGGDTDLPSLVRCAEAAVAMLPEAKQPRLREAIARLDAKVAGPPSSDGAQPDYPDFGWQTARALIEADGVEGLVAAAREKSGALRYGRAEALLAAGARAAGHHQTDETARRLAMTAGVAEQLNETLLTLARAAEPFEQGDLAHTAAMLAAQRCDLARFEAARALTLAPGALRYTFWRARITGDWSGLPEAIMLGASAEDSGPARQAMDGIGFLAEYGSCGSQLR